MYILLLRNVMTDELVYVWRMCLLKSMPERELWTQQSLYWEAFLPYLYILVRQYLLHYHRQQRALFMID